MRLSIRDRDAKSTRRSCFANKSALMIGLVTSAIINTKEKFLRRPKLRISYFKTYVFIEESTELYRGGLGFTCCLTVDMVGGGGLMLISAPASMRKRFWIDESKMGKVRRDLVSLPERLTVLSLPDSTVEFTVWLCGFPLDSDLRLRHSGSRP